MVAASQVQAQGHEIGRSGWLLERPSRDFVLLRSTITLPEREGAPNAEKIRQGLFMLACEPRVRRIRFQMSETPRSPSIRASSHGRAIVRGWGATEKPSPEPIYPDVLFFEDGSFEFQETASFGNSVMRGLLAIMQESPTRLEVLLFKGAQTRSFARGEAMQFRLSNLEENLGNIYGFEGLCFRHTK